MQLIAPKDIMELARHIICAIPVHLIVYSASVLLLLIAYNATLLITIICFIVNATQIVAQTDTTAIILLIKSVCLVSAVA